MAEWWEGSIDVNKANQKAALADELMRATLASALPGAPRTGGVNGVPSNWMAFEDGLQGSESLVPYNPYLHNRPADPSLGAGLGRKGLREEEEARKRSGVDNLSPGERDASVSYTHLTLPTIYSV